MPLWRSWFGADPVRGRAQPTRSAGASRTIVGVMRPEFQFPNDGTLLWVVGPRSAPTACSPGRFGYGTSWAGWRRAPTREAVAAELTALARGLPERFGGSPGYAALIEQHRAVVRPLLDEMLGPAARSLWVLFAAVGDRAPDRVRQRGEPLHGSRRRAPARSRRAPRDRGLARRSWCACRWRRRWWRRSARRSRGRGWPG